MRAEPALDAAEASCGNSPSSPVRLGAGDVVWITDEEPQVHDAYLWYPVVAPNETCELALMAGWVAAGPVDDPEWIEPFAEDCPEPVTLGSLSPSPLRRLECHGGEKLTLHGFVPRIPEGIGFTCPGVEPSWLTCGIGSVTEFADSDVALSIRTPPGVETPGEGAAVVVTGAIDDPRAESCSEPAHRFSDIVVEIYCRTQFVVESMAPDG